MKPDSGFRVKVVFSYILLFAFMGGAAWYVYKSLYPLIYQEDDRREEILERSLLVSSTLSGLYQAEWLGTRFIQDAKDSNYVLYCQSLGKVNSLLDSLRRVTAQTRQLQVIDQIDSLLQCRDANILEIAQQQQELGRLSLADIGKQVDRALLPIPPVTHARQFPTAKPVDPVTVREEIIYDTVRTAIVRFPSERSSFLQRLGNAIAGQKQMDSVTEVRQIRRTITDTLVRVIPGTPLADAERTKDTVVQTVRKVFDSASAQRERRQEAMAQQLDRLVQSDRALNNQINTLLEALNQEWVSGTFDTLQERSRSLELAARQAWYIGLAALAVVLVSLILIFNDLNKSRRYRRELETARNKADELQKSQEKLLLTVTHDIKAPLSSIIGYLDLLRSPSDHSSAQTLQEYLDSMSRSAEHVMDLLGNLLEYYRLEASKAQLVPAVVGLRGLLEEVLEVFAPTAAKKGVALHLITQIDPGQGVVTDAMHLRQILTNLVSNAVKFTDSGRVDITAHITEPSPDGPSVFHCCVYDTGIGIDPEKQQHIFEEFMRVEQPRVPGKEGVGLGLSIVKRLVTLFGGQVTVARNEEGGATFCVDLPMELSPDPVQPVSLSGASSAAETGPCGGMPPLRVLVVDDDPAQLTVSSEMLRRGGYLGVAAQSVAQAIDYLSKLKVDIVLTDIQMPTRDGFSLLEHIRSQMPSPPPVVAVTANSLLNRAEFREKGFAEMLPKPFAGAALYKLLESMRPAGRSDATGLYHLGELTAMMDGDLEAVQQVMEVFAGSLEENIRLLTQAGHSRDYSRAGALAHKMLPVFRQIQSPLAASLVVLEHSAGATEEELGKNLREVVRGGADLLAAVQRDFTV